MVNRVQYIEYSLAHMRQSVLQSALYMPVHTVQESVHQSNCHVTFLLL
jgi:hypothetical protein